MDGPYCADAWDGQMHFLADNGFRVVAHDRRGHGRSSQARSGNDMDGYADDLAAVIEALDLKDVTLVGHSTGGGLALVSSIEQMYAPRDCYRRTTLLELRGVSSCRHNISTSRRMPAISAQARSSPAHSEHVKPRPQEKAL